MHNKEIDTDTIMQLTSPITLLIIAPAVPLKRKKKNEFCMDYYFHNPS